MEQELANGLAVPDWEDRLEADVSEANDGAFQEPVEGDVNAGAGFLARADAGVLKAPLTPPLESISDQIEDGPSEREERAGVVEEACEPAVRLPRLQVPRVKRRRGKRLVAPGERDRRQIPPAERLLLLDTWRRSGLTAGDFGGLVGISRHTLYKWHKKFEEYGPAGLEDRPRRGGGRSNKLSDVTRRAILMMKQEHPEWGCQRISDMLLRGPALPASPKAVAKCLHAAGYETVVEATRPHREKVRRFERAKPNQLWQTDLFTFTLKRQNRRVHLVVFLDDHSRFIVSYGLHATASTAMVLEALEAGIASYGAPEEVLTDNGPQYVTWRGKSAFAKQCEKRGIKQIVARPKRPQTLGKTERFWGTLWRECVESAIFVDLGDARTRIGHFMDYYNFQRTHQGIEGLAPADRFFDAAPKVKETLKARVAGNALELARHGAPKSPFYLTGQTGGKTFSVHSEGERMVFMKEGEGRREIDLGARHEGEAASLPDPSCPQGIVNGVLPEAGNESPAAPGVSAIDGLPRDIGREDSRTDAENG